MIAFIAVIAVAVVARFVGLSKSLWADEITTLINFVRPAVGDLISNFSSLNNHPLYSLVAKASVTAFGESAVSLRLPAVLFGIGSIAAFLPVARRVLTMRLTLLTLLLLAISYHHVWFSQNARGYTMLLFWTTLATTLFLEGAKRNSARIWTAYGIVFAAAMYSHLSAAFYYTAHGIIYSTYLFNRFALGRNKESPLAGMYPFFGMALGVILTLLAYAPMVLEMPSTFGGVRNTAASSPLAQWTDPIFVLRNLVEQFLSFGPFMAIVLPPVTGVALFGAYKIWKEDRLLAAIYLLQFPITIVALKIAGMRIWPRFFFVEISFLYLALVVGVFVIAGILGAAAARRMKFDGAENLLKFAAAISMVSGASLLLARNYQAPKQDFAGAVALVNQDAGANDLRTVYGVTAEPVISYYAPDWSELTPEMIRAFRGEQRIWVVVAFRFQVEGRDPDLWREFEEKFVLRKRLPGTLGGGDVLIYESKAP
ncbi:MAG: glycosyltransferase family 39 protein [Parvularculaceae bacterium]